MNRWYVAIKYTRCYVLLNNLQMKIKGTEFSQVMYDRLNDAIEGYENTYNSVDELIREFTICDIERLLTMLIDDRKALIHQIDTVKGLWATDKPN